MQSQLACVYISSLSRRVTVSPVCQLSSLLMTVSPEALGKIKPGGTRDFSVNGDPIYSLDLSYSWDQPQKGKVLPRFPKLDGLLYSYAWDSKFWMLFDANKKLISSGDL